jgi:general secretion pathway protein G
LSGDVKNVSCGGFTLLEVMVVIGIIGMMITIIMSTSVGQLEKSRMKKTQADLRSMKAALDIYAMEEGSGKYPGSWDDVKTAMEAHGIDWFTCKDGWDQSYKYYIKSDKTRYYILSAGTGGTFDDEDDQYVTEKRTPMQGNPDLADYKEITEDD